MIYAILFFIFVLYLLFAIFNPAIMKLFGKKVCAVCAAVSLTWIAILLLKYLGYMIDSLIPAILMGESITGLMYLFEDYAEKKNKRLLMLKIAIILIGTLVAYLLLKWI